MRLETWQAVTNKLYESDKSFQTSGYQQNLRDWLYICYVVTFKSRESLNCCRYKAIRIRVFILMCGYLTKLILVLCNSFLVSHGLYYPLKLLLVLRIWSAPEILALSLNFNHTIRHPCPPQQRCLKSPQEATSCLNTMLPSFFYQS